MSDPQDVATTEYQRRQLRDERLRLAELAALLEEKLDRMLVRVQDEDTLDLARAFVVDVREHLARASICDDPDSVTDTEAARRFVNGASR